MANDDRLGAEALRKQKLRDVANAPSRFFSKGWIATPSSRRLPTPNQRSRESTRVNIDLKQLEGLLKVLEERDISEFEFEDEKARVHVKRGQPVVASVYPGHGPTIPNAMGSVPDAAAAAKQEGGVFVTCPFVGTFYRSPSPDAPPFVDVGSTIKPGQPLCIVEAMKLMNEIEAEFSGVVLECLVETGSPVEFGQKLFRVKKI
jgi:acetyl-CoA carboxylase biotin carboxyl carrier protein